MAGAAGRVEERARPGADGAVPGDDDAPPSEPPASAADEDRRLRRAVLAVCALAFVVFVASPVRQNHDAYLSFPTAYTIVHERTLDLRSLPSPEVQEHYGLVDGPGGSRVDYFPWVLSLFHVPAVLALDAAHAVGVGPGAGEVADGGPMDLLGVVAASGIAVGLLATVAAVAADRLARDDARRRRLTVVAITVGLAFGTGVWSVASRALWQHGPSMLAVALAVWCLQRLALAPGSHPGRLATGAGAALAAAYTFRPTNATVVVLATAYLALRHRHLLVRYGTGALAVAVPWVLVNLAAYGSVLQPYYAAQRVGLHDQLAEALTANLVSPNRGLLVFTPIAALAVPGLVPSWRRPLRDGLVPLDRVLAAGAVLQWVAASAYGEKWWAGNSYGARFLTDTLVLLAILAVPAVATLVGRVAAPGRRAVAVAAALALMWSGFAASQGALARATACWHERSGIDRDPTQVWSLDPPQALAGVDRLARTGSLRATVLDDCAPDPAGT